MKTSEIQYPPLAAVAHASIGTAAAAHYLQRRPQTLRDWACNESGPLRPFRVNGRLQWRISEIRQVMQVPA